MRPTLAGGAEPGRSRFVIFSNCKRSKTSNPTVFAGGGNSRRWGRAGPGRPRRPGSALPVIFSNHGPKPDLVCEISIPRDVSPARQLVINRTVFLRAMSPPPRCFEAATCSLVRARGFFGSRSLPASGIRSRVCHAPIPCLLYTSPSPRDGLLSRMPSSA